MSYDQKQQLDIKVAFSKGDAFLFFVECAGESSWEKSWQKRKKVVSFANFLWL